MPKSKLDWKDGILVLSIVLMATGFVLPLHHLVLLREYDIGGDTRSVIDAQPLSIQESLYVDKTFAWMRNSTYAQFYDANSNIFTDVFFPNLGMFWIILLILSMGFCAISMSVGKFKGYYTHTVGLATLCSFLAVGIFYASYGHMLGMISGHSSFSGTGYDSIGGVTWTSTPQWGFYLPLIGAFLLFIIFSLAWKKR